MSNALRRIYKQNLLCEQGYPSAPEHQSSLSENTPDSPVKTNLYAELDDAQGARSVIGAAAPKSPKSIPAPVTTGISMSPKMPSQRKIRHRRLGSADSNYHFLLPKQNDRRNIRMVHMETQTDAIDNFDDTNVNASEIADALSTISIKSLEMSPLSMKMEEEKSQNTQHNPIELSTEEAMQNGNNTCDDTVDHHSTNAHPDEQLIYDYMNSNEQLDIRESSDEDNVEVLNRRVSQFFTQNGLLQTDNGNGIIDNRLLFNIMAARRSCISINDKDEVTVMSRGNSLRTSTTANMYGAHAHDSSRRNSISYKISDHNCNNDDGDDSWTDEEGENSDHNYSLRRRRFVAI